MLGGVLNLHLQIRSIVVDSLMCKPAYSNRFTVEEQCYETLHTFKLSLVGICLFKTNNRNTRTRCEICSKLTVKASEERYTAVNDIILVSVSFTLNRFHNCNLTIAKNSQTLISSSSASSSGYWTFYFSAFKAWLSWSSFESLSLVVALYIWLRKSLFFEWKHLLVGSGIDCPENVTLKI